MFAYHVWEWTRSAPAQSSTIARSTPSVWIAALAAIAFFGFSSGQLVGYTVDLFQRWF